MQFQREFFSISFRKEIIVFIILFFIAVKRIQCDICELCNCTQEIDENCGSLSNNQCFNKDIFVCNGNDQRFRKLNQTIQLDNVEWPNGKNVSASFNNLKLTFLTKLFCSKTSILTEINLNDNFIDSVTNDPFKYCTDLKIISISNNLLQQLPQDFLNSVIQIEKLNLSHNALTEFRDDILSKHQHLIELDLSHNQITTLKLNKILHQSPNIESINVASNELFLINGDSDIKHYSLKQLNLTGNKLTVLTTSSFVAFPNLHSIYLSSNELRNIEENAFTRLDKLIYLDLSQNQLRDISLNLSNSIEHLILTKNNLNYWPIKSIPINLTILELQSNNLVELVDRMELPNVKLLNVSHNEIEAFPLHLQCPKLKVLDLSYNRFTHIPIEIGRQIPNLDWFKMNGNLMQEIKIVGKLIARKLELSNLPLLQELNATEFSALESKTTCIRITISHCPLLKTIHNTFPHTIDLCALDLSYNAITVIDEDLASWSFLSRGINLQGNPFRCTCQDAQWMIDILVPQIYGQKEHQHFLDNLRCASPAHFAQHRLLRYFKHEQAFCEDNVGKNKEIHKGLLALVDDTNSNELRFNEGMGLIITVSMLTIIISTCILIIIIIVRRHRLRKSMKNNRRFETGGFF